MSSTPIRPGRLRLFWLAMGVGLLLPSHLWADFDLPILYPVAKTISVSERMPAEQMARLAAVDDLTLEVRLTGGNMMRDTLVQLLNDEFARATKRVVLEGRVKPIHVKQLRRLKRFEVTYRIGAEGLSAQTFNALYALGPVRKFIVIPMKYDQQRLSRIGQLKFFVPVVRLGQGPLETVLVNWIDRKKNRLTRFVVPADMDPARVYDLIQFRPVTLEIRTIKNRLPEKIYKVIKDIRRVGVEFVVDGRLTLDDVRQLAKVERFSLKVELGRPVEMTPGLVGLLNRVAPP